MLISRDLSFKEHIDDVVQSSKIMSGMLLRTFETREERLMVTMFKSHIRSKLEYGSLVWNPSKKEDIDKLEGIQRNFTSKIRGMEKLDYHQRLERLKLYSLERR